jgi:Predicted AAA-ATPase/PD-(D/E)XK nuclease superfamily
MIKIAYGKSNFKEVIDGKCFYQDRTSYIRQLEDTTSSYLFYLRPRRFGKSLFITMLNYYYAIEFKDQFQAIFGKLAIGKKPTALANSYLVLSLEFSGILTDTPKETFEGFLFNVKDAVGTFLAQYEEYFTPEQAKTILSQEQPNMVMRRLFSYHNDNKVPIPIYVLIDEYDHFANELVSFNFDYFKKIVTKTGFVRKFYETIKKATRDSVVQRIFITGVSPITLDSLTSGFNIATNLSTDVNFHQMMGFDETEVTKLLQKIGTKKADLPIVLDDLRVWYDGYLFNVKAKNHVYNPDMVLCFALHYQQYKNYPDTLLDNNIASDYSKIRNVFKIKNQENQNLEALRILTETGRVTSQLTTQFSFEKNFGKDDLVSLLFYMGFLTVEKADLAALVFKFPNFVIKRLYADYFVSILQQYANLPIDNSQMNESIRLLANTGNFKPFLDQVSGILKVLSNRDAFHFNEMSLKAIFVSCLYQQQFYYVHSEYETEKGYADIFLEGIRGYDPNYQIAVELKYIKKVDKKAEYKKLEDDDIQKLLKQAEVQLTNYMVTKKFIDRKGLKGFVIICHADKLIYKEHGGFPLPLEIAPTI